MEQLLDGIEKQEEWKQKIIYLLFDIAISSNSYTNFKVSANASLWKEKSDIRKAITQSCKSSKLGLPAEEMRISWVENFVNIDCKTLQFGNSLIRIASERPNSSAPLLATVVSSPLHPPLHKNQVKCVFCGILMSRKSIARHLKNQHQALSNLIPESSSISDSKDFKSSGNASVADSEEEITIPVKPREKRRRIAKARIRMETDSTDSEYADTSPQRVKKKSTKQKFGGLRVSLQNIPRYAISSEMKEDLTKYVVSRYPNCAQTELQEVVLTLSRFLGICAEVEGGQLESTVDGLFTKGVYTSECISRMLELGASSKTVVNFCSRLKILLNWRRSYTSFAADTFCNIALDFKT